MDQEKDQTGSVQTAASAEDLARQDQEKAQELGLKIDKCLERIKEMDADIATLMKSQDYYRKKMRKLARKRDVALNLRLL